VPIYLGRRHITPGTLASYLQLITSDLRQRGVFGAVRQLAVHKTRRVAKKLLPRAMGRAPNLANVFSAYEVCLNLSNVWADGRPGSPLLSHIRLRDFEAPMCRACYLTGYNDEITEFYKVGREIDAYRDKPELVDKARFYLANPAAAKPARSGISSQDHTWTRQFEELFSKIGLNANHP
jgi:spore maturation protein CgeB